MKIVALTGLADTGCGWYRITRPLAMLKEKCGVETHIVNIDSNGNIDIDLKGALVIIHRLILRDPEDYINKLRKLGAAKVIYELDDDIVSLAYVDYIRDCGRYSDNGLLKINDNRKKVITTLNACDAVTVSTNVLRNLVSKFTDTPIYVLENSIDVEWFNSRIHKIDELSNKITIGWAGGFRPNKDLEIMGKAWRIIRDKYNNKVQFIVAGWQADALYEYLEVEDVKRIAWTSLEEWPNNMQMDIGCVGLADTPFNECKSPIKWYEYTLAGAVVIAPSIVYQDVVIDRLNCMIANTVEEYVNDISNLIDSKHKRRVMLDEAIYAVNSYRVLVNNVQDWYFVYDTVMS